MSIVKTQVAGESIIIFQFAISSMSDTRVIQNDELKEKFGIADKSLSEIRGYLSTPVIDKEFLKPVSKIRGRILRKLDECAVPTPLGWIVPENRALEVQKLADDSALEVVEAAE
jgi:hypothetical protein